MHDNMQNMKKLHTWLVGFGCMDGLKDVKEIELLGATVMVDVLLVT
jgi:hypothetical protein